MKKLTNYMLDLGRIVAFHPNLKWITGSTTAAILLSQFIYWLDKTKDGWIYKDSYEIEEETSLTYYEQTTARKVLLDLGIISEEYKRLDHKIAFRVNEDVLNNLWEQETGKESKKRFTEEKPASLSDYQDPALHPPSSKMPPATRNVTGKQGDLVDGLIAFAQTPGARKDAIKADIRNKIENLIHINTESLKWDKTIDYIYTRQEKYNEPVEKFIHWAIKVGFNPIYWTPEKMKTLYPQAFVEDTSNKPKEDFVEEPPVQPEEEYMPMPEDLKPKRKLY